MLFIVGTPLGNIQDTSLRVVKTLTTTEIILAEDTRNFVNFYHSIQNLFNIHSSVTDQKIVPFHDQNEFKQIPLILDWLKSGKSVALVSENGMPTFSDPGSLLISAVRKANLDMTVIPGPTAATTALALSGFSARQCVFIGFLPKKPSEISKILQTYDDTTKSLKEAITLIIYESPQRLHKTLSLIGGILPTATLCVARELTKQFEEFIVVTDPLSVKPKGEIVILVSLTGKQSL